MIDYYLNFVSFSILKKFILNTHLIKIKMIIFIINLKKSILLLIILSIKILAKEEPFIIIPFKSAYISYLRNNYINQDNKYNHFIFFNENYNLRMYSKIKIGTPPQDVIAILNTNIEYL